MRARAASHRQLLQHTGSFSSHSLPQGPQNRQNTEGLTALGSCELAQPQRHPLVGRQRLQAALLLLLRAAGATAPLGPGSRPAAGLQWPQGWRSQLLQHLTRSPPPCRPRGAVAVCMRCCA